MMSARQLDRGPQPVKLLDQVGHAERCRHPRQRDQRLGDDLVGIPDRLIRETRVGVEAPQEQDAVVLAEHRHNVLAGGGGLLPGSPRRALAARRLLRIRNLQDPARSLGAAHRPHARGPPGPWLAVLTQLPALKVRLRGRLHDCSPSHSQRRGPPSAGSRTCGVGPRA
jgi:hypothetical protein